MKDFYDFCDFIEDRIESLKSWYIIKILIPVVSFRIFWDYAENDDSGDRKRFIFVGSFYDCEGHKKNWSWNSKDRGWISS